jgi:hypothetical protein
MPDVKVFLGLIEAKDGKWEGYQDWEMKRE